MLATMTATELVRPVTEDIRGMAAQAEAERRFDAGLGIAVPARWRAKLDAP